MSAIIAQVTLILVSLIGYLYGKDVSAFVAAAIVILYIENK